MEEKLKILTSSRYRIGWHVLFWTGSLVFFTLFFGHQQKEYTYTFYFVALLLPITMITAYLFLYYLVPRFLITRKYAAFTIRGIFVILVSFYFGTLAVFLMLFFFMYGKGPKMDPTTVDIYFLAVGMYFVVLAAVAIKLFKLWYEKQQTERKLEKEKLVAELNMLKSQIHPHFLFNTLNNIYALALQKSDVTADMLVRLSEILHYILYECNDPLVPLEKEITLIRNYVELEKIRYGQRLELIWKIPAFGQELKVAPMIFLPFVENAFKHGASKKRDKVMIRLDLAIEGSALHFKIKNSKPSFIPEHSQNTRQGLGLDNVKQRLDLVYPGKHALTIMDHGEQYDVHLIIQTNQRT